jgi:hypothetical protein
VAEFEDQNSLIKCGISGNFQKRELGENAAVIRLLFRCLAAEFCLALLLADRRDALTSMPQIRDPAVP